MAMDPFVYFRGGREGVKQRFAAAVCEALRQLTVRELLELEQAIDVSPGTLSALVRGNLESIDSRLISSLSYRFDLPIDEVFGEVVGLSDEEADALAQNLEDEGVATVAGCNANTLRPRDRLRVGLLLKAFHAM